VIEIELTDYNQKVQKLIDCFDLNLERNLDFDISICFHGPDQNYEEEKNLKDLLDELRENGTEWDRISASCRRMIICDRELDLGLGLDILKKSLKDFEFLLDLNYEQDWLKDPQILKNLIEKESFENIYEIIRYINTCGLISYRSGNYPNAFEFFNLAEHISDDYGCYYLYFLPDVISNRIRTEFELFYQVLPKPIPKDHGKILEEKITDCIISYSTEIASGSTYNFENVDEKYYLIYGHGMASLYHNLAEAYGKLIEARSASSMSNFMLNEHAKNANEMSLKFGENFGDKYRQLQSKNALRRYDPIKKEKYEREILEGEWKRGKVIICQERIREMRKSEDEDKEKVKERIKQWTEKDYFTLDIDVNDKIGLLYNYDSIKKFMVENDFEEIKIKENIFTLMDIAYNKIKIADQLRNIYSPLLYRRQIMKLIRDDISFVTNNFLNREKYITALSFNEHYSNRGLIELLDSNIDKNDPNLQKHMEEIQKIKSGINSSIDAKRKQVNDCEEIIQGDLSIVLDTEPDENYLKLIFAYENILKSASLTSNKNIAVENKLETQMLSFKGIEFENIIRPLIERLKKIPKEEETIVIKFLVTSFKSYYKEKSEIIPTTIWAFLIDRNDVRKKAQVNSPSDINYNEFIDEAQKGMEKFAKIKTLNRDTRIHDKMKELADDLKIYNEIKDVKNIFILPDGELFQLPLHLLEKEGNDLRKTKCVYYSPSLTYLLNKQADESSDKLKAKKYLWICSPAKDLFTTEKSPCLHKPRVGPKNIDFLECEEGTLENFNEMYEDNKDNKYTHIGFSTHAAFHDNVVTSYVSLIKLYDSFLTTYDILLLMNFNNIETIFLGACSGALTKYTDENESIGLVTAFLLKGANSVVAPICKISGYLHNQLIDHINENNMECVSEGWNLDHCNILKTSIEGQNLTKGQWTEFIPFVQYSNLGIIENKYLKY